MDYSKEAVSSINNRTDAHMNTQRLWQQARDCTCLSPASRGCEDKLSSPTKKVFAIDSSWKRESQFSPIECYWVYQPHSRTETMPRSGLVNIKWKQNISIKETNISLFVWLLFFCFVCLRGGTLSFILFCHFCIIWISVFGLLFYYSQIKENEKEQEVGCVGS